MCYNKEKMKTCAQNAGRRELLPGAKRPRKSNGAAIFNIDSFHYKKQTIKQCAYRLYAVERKIDTKVRNIGQQKCYNDLRKRRRSLAWHEQRASRLKNFALVSARKRAGGRIYSGFGFQTALSARNAAVRNITQFAGGTRSSAVPADTRLPSPQKPLCTARICP